MTDLPADPFALVRHAPFRVADRRELEICGRRTTLVWLPERRTRPGVPTDGMPPFRPDRVARILADETVWRSGGLALTPNRYPFAARQLILWSERPLREPDREMLEVGFALAEAVDGTILFNSVGAAASVPRAHAHLLAERGSFLTGMATSPLQADWVDPIPGVEVATLTRFPCTVLELRGPTDLRARAVHRLLELRTSPAFNLVADRDRCWIAPRSPVEIPAPHFPHALGAAELWGRWCYADENAFRAATPDDLERALRIGGYPP